MPHDLAAYSAPSSAVATSVDVPFSSSSTANLSWDETALTFDDLPREARKHAPAAGVIAESVLAISGVHGARSGSPRLVRLAFRAYVDRIILLTVSHPLVPRGDRFAAVGQWEVSGHQKLLTAGGVRAIRQVGKVSPGCLVSDEASQRLTEEPSREMVSAVEAEAYLPPEVRQALTRAIPQPTTHLGEIIRYGEDRSATQEVVVLRADGARAVVVKAERKDNAAATWSVSQWTYMLRSDGRELSA